MERRFYGRQDLAHHKRKGDKDNTSFRGHPLCQFCDKRYFDDDDLFKHLRMDHYFCHFCDADGLNHFYDTYDNLRVHFRCDHFLCEEENCKEEKFTSVFRTKIDLKGRTSSNSGPSKVIVLDSIVIYCFHFFQLIKRPYIVDYWESMELSKLGS